MSLRVVRVGGSLLTWNQFLPTFPNWLAKQPAAFNVLVAGGGPWVELLRQAAKRFELTEPTAHVLCLQALSTTTSLLGEVLGCPTARSVNDVQAALASEDGELTRCIVFDVYDHLESIDRQSATPLPRTWHVTSDSIAARIARDLCATELVLLKSADCPLPVDEQHDRSRLSELGYVDGYFPVASRGQDVRYVNLRTE